MSNDPREVYSRLLDERRSEIARLELRHRRLGYSQLAVLASAVAIVVLALARHAWSIAWIVIPVGVFVVLLILHDRVMRQLEQRRRSVRYFERASNRLEGKWIGTGEAGDAYLAAEHPYALDLDLFGKGSLFELLCTARTHIGEETLARWLLTPATPGTVRRRHSAVNELRPRLDLREDLAVLAEDARTGLDPESLAAWGEAPPLLPSKLRFVLWGLTVLGVAAAGALGTLIVYNGGLISLSPNVVALLRDFVAVAILLNAYWTYRNRHAAAAVVGAVDQAAHEVRLLSEVLVRLEKETFESPLLRELRGSLDAEGEPPSRRIARLNRIMEYLDSRDNVFVRVIEVFVLWTPHWALAAEEWRRHSGKAVRRWLHAAGEMEALCSLASHAFEHPADPFPEFFEGDGAFDAEAIGHPLIPEDRVVRNDVRLGAAGESGPRVLIVSGSNMSGKSTMLRTVGINAVLAQAGAPVRARRLRLSPLAVGASIRVSDSLQSGVSRFYAEILRLRQILDLTAGSLPVLFLIDEFLHGTNSHDRRIGAEALVRGLVARHAIGLITTHDLALADIAGALGDRAANVHFEDQIADGQIRFDYVMRAGVVRKSNAIELMRSVGLEI